MRRPTRGALGGAFVFVVAAGCTVGGYPRGFTDAPHGAEVTVEYTGSDSEVNGELLLVRDDGLIALFSGQVTLVRWESVTDISLRGVSLRDLRRGQVPSPAKRDQMRKLSRYPYSLTEEQLAGLLAELGQRELVVL